ncbi:hypothetical protein [Actinomycetospora straminea]|uniref:Uncharacterized protein n=1 Tax=Actinomycetospora straminea TaxID=663607 RepID=A0ABP9E5N1_9PSEU|nr:hypothetical protein [Actinomycetospora straminea]MDD7931102.1 hypothetical protein [Actinomycetospora straminea]
MATRRFWPGRRGGTGRPPTPAGPPPGTDPSTPRGTLSSLPGVPAGPGTPEELRFAQVYAADRVGPMPYPNQATPDVGAARGRVRTLVQELLDGVDEGTGAALDPLIASWASGWLSRIDSQHADHQAVVDRLVGGARQQLAEAEAAHERDRRALAIARRDYDEARERLGEPVGTAAPAPRPSSRRTSAPADEPDVAPADPPTGPMPRPVGGDSIDSPPRRPERGDPMRPGRHGSDR